MTWWACGGEALLKVYRAIEPVERRNREAQALTLARSWGVSTPAVRAVGEEDGYCWVLVDAVGGAAARLSSRKSVEGFVQHTLRLTAVLRDRPALGGPGTGWLPARAGNLTNSGALLHQLSQRCRPKPWWPELCQSLTSVDDEECVHLHGDIKPEHFLRSGRSVHVVDWEAAARGPVVCDLADAAFHLIRDLVYAGPSPLPLDVIGRLPVTGPVAAWRLLRWLDRRRPGDLDLVPAQSLRDLTASPDPPGTVRVLARLITALRDAGVPR
ncbi:MULTISPECIES: phosphotransferase [unclassified Streptomyces]|uniref:phosphotransferase n=1 Tax=unclassified Streptomyces TaxID=2593676 RepID=UPI002E29DAE5|nr:phosphotransferase [Streptomyces sp. NBC_00223]